MGDAVIQTQINGKKFMYINLTLASLLSLWRFWLRGQRDTKWADIKIKKKNGKNLKNSLLFLKTWTIRFDGRGLYKDEIIRKYSDI